MTSTEDILKAMAAEKHKIMASAIKPQLQPNLTAADIVKAHRDNVKPGRGGQNGHSAELTQVHIITSVNRLLHLDQCARVLMAKALRFTKE